MTKDKKKDAPGGAPIPEQDYRTIPGGKSQWLAEFLLNNIGDREHPMKRPKDPSVDRVLRDMIAKTVTERKAFIINSGDGYYMPSIEDAPSVREYIGKERARAKAITERADAIEAMLNEMIKKALPEGSTTKTTYIVNKNRGEINGYMENQRPVQG